MKRLLLIRGGLGNQIFQICYMHAVSVREELARYRILTLPRTDPNRFPEVGRIIAKCQHGYKNGLIENLMAHSPRKIQHLASLLLNSPKLKKFFWRKLIFKETLEFSSDFIYTSAKTSPIIIGNFQHWKYAEIAGKEFWDEVTNFLDEESTCLSLVVDTSYLAIHLRKGDYANTKFGILNFDYYLQISELHRGLKVLIFTDDNERGYALSRYFDNVQVFGPKDCQPAEVIQVFSRAKVCVPANSTLSWWGSFLASKRGAIVYIPDPWFESHSDTFGAFLAPGMIPWPSRWD
jgi:hypothetical protein